MIRPHLPLIAADDLIAADRPLWEMGLDSLGAISLLVEIEELFEITFEPEDVTIELFSTAGYLWGVVDRMLEQDQ
jgi:acyl carrier protein